MPNLKVMQYFMRHPKEIISLGYQAMMRKKNTVNYEEMVRSKYGKTKFPTIDLLDLFPDFQGSMNDYSFLPGTSTIVDILLLQLLAKKYDQCEYLEIGSFRGESIAAVAQVAKECTSVTLSYDEMKAFGYTDNLLKAHGLFSKDKPNVIPCFHNSQTFDFSSLNKKFDLIFVDGAHEYECVVKDTQNVFKLLKNDKSIIVWHDYAFDPENVRHEVMAAIVEGTPEQYHQNLYHVSNSMCAVFIRDKFPASSAEDAVPNKSFKIEVKARKLAPL